MKKIIVLTLVLSLMAVSIEAKNVNAAESKTSVNEPKWEKSKEGTWAGMNKTWYKLNPKDASVWVSTDGKKWEAAKDGMWQDKEGKWMKIGDKKLWWSKDGKEWAEVPEWKWEGTDGIWNKFDKDWNLWIAKK
ncbi:MAG: hypothetical protein ACT4ON_04550 [Bacteroidota bacterium]